MPLAELVVNNYNSASTSISLFFLTYSYYVHLVELDNIEVPI